VADGTRIGREGPATVQDCYVGPEVELNGGYFQQATFLQKASCGLGAHVRQGTILEEHASVAHTVGLKQTILFPFVTLGSLINFCDCLMAGGTGPKNHSEVGSSYIHFNFTPNQDKATPSLIGDVVEGVMLNQSPIFLGGQGGLVGPLQIAYGTVIAAGSICRKDQLKPGRLVIEGAMPTARMPFNPGKYQNIKRLLKKNFIYIAQLTALRHWYARVRSCFIGPALPKALHEGLVATLDKAIAERLQQLEKLRGKIETLGEQRSESQTAFCRMWPQKMAQFADLQRHGGDKRKIDGFLEAIEASSKENGPLYIDTIQGLSRSQAELGSQWLQGIVDYVMSEISK
jgi:UDP-N-acetylglucosamine/UDP-N-acetylgalactosamine diphosphorylase